ncbi:MAG: hypothetical protein ABI120_14865 [Gemmatimonadaceae bacterium]
MSGAFVASAAESGDSSEADGPVEAFGKGAAAGTAGLGLSPPPQASSDADITIVDVAVTRKTSQYLVDTRST